MAQTSPKRKMSPGAFVVGLLITIVGLYLVGSLVMSSIGRMFTPSGPQPTPDPLSKYADCLISGRVPADLTLAEGDAWCSDPAHW